MISLLSSDCASCWSSVSELVEMISVVSSA